MSLLEIVKFSYFKARVLERALKFENLSISSGEISQFTGKRWRICISCDQSIF